MPGARLLLKYGGMEDPAVGDRLRPLLAAGGVGPERVELRGGSAHAAHVAAYTDAIEPASYRLDMALLAMMRGAGESKLGGA